MFPFLELESETGLSVKGAGVATEGGSGGGVDGAPAAHGQGHTGAKGEAPAVAVGRALFVAVAGRSLIAHSQVAAGVSHAGGDAALQAQAGFRQPYQEFGLSGIAHSQGDVGGPGVLCSSVQAQSAHASFAEGADVVPAAFDGGEGLQCTVFIQADGVGEFLHDVDAAAVDVGGFRCLSSQAAPGVMPVQAGSDAGAAFPCAHLLDGVEVDGAGVAVPALVVARGDAGAFLAHGGSDEAASGELLFESGGGSPGAAAVAVSTRVTFNTGFVVGGGDVGSQAGFFAELLAAAHALAQLSQAGKVAVYLTAHEGG